MTEPSPADKNRESDLPFLWHESEVDVAAELGLTDAVPTGEFIRCEHIHVLSEFDFSQQIDDGGADSNGQVTDRPSG